MMFRKFLLPTLAASALLLFSTVLASAQVGALYGKVKVKQADGTAVPAVGAVVDVFRTDISGKYEAKTDKKGEFRWVGLPYSGTYILAASAHGAQPNFQADVKVGREVDYELVLEPGDGRRLTLDEIRTILKEGGAKTAASGGKTESSTDKAKRAEIEAKNREIIEKNKKVEDSNKIIGEKFKLGNTAMAAGEVANKDHKYAEADTLFTDSIAQYDEGIAADPQHPGTPTLMTNKAQALMDRGVARYNSTITSESYKAASKSGGGGTSAMLEPARKDWKDAAESATKAVEALKTQPAPTDPT